MAEWVDAGKVGITPKGEFDLSTAYEKNDLVSYQSYAFLCQQNCTGIAPVIGTVTEYWQPFGSSVEGDNTTTEIVDGKITVKDYVSKTEVDGISGDVTDLSDTVDAVIEQIGSEEELANLPDPAGSLSKNITQINSNLTDTITKNSLNTTIRSSGGVFGNFITGYGCSAFVPFIGADKKTIVLTYANIYGIAGDKTGELQIVSQKTDGFVLGASNDYSGRLLDVGFSAT